VQAFAKSYVGGDGNAEPGPVEQYKGILSVPTFSQKYSFCREDLTVRLHFQRIDGFMEESSNWLRPPDSLSLEAGQVHVWRICLEQGDDQLDRFRRILEPAELDRAGRFRFERLQRHFIASRGFLRYVLARYLAEQPEDLRFTFNSYGKPSLAGERSLQFNMSHSHEVALVAVTRDAAVGVDVEHIRSDFASEEIATRFFSHLEVETLKLLPKEEQVAAFFRCWARKEAYIKAIGKGLSQPLDGFDVTLAPDEPAALLRRGDDDTITWLMTDIDVGADYASALAVERAISEITLWHYSLNAEDVG
jgi:4'-phosphopantetheinyl transferase